MTKPKQSLFSRLLVSTGMAELKETPQAAEETTQEQVVPASASVSVSSSDSSVVSGVVDPDIKSQLEKELEQENASNPQLHGIDFFEYKRGLSMAQGATAKDRAAFAFQQASAFSSSPLSKQHLLDTSEIYLEVLNRESQEFEQHVSSAIEQQVSPLNTESQTLKNRNAEIEAEIKKLNKEKTTNINRINDLSSEAYKLQRKIDQTAANFHETLDHVIKEHEAAVEAIKMLPDSE